MFVGCELFAFGVAGVVDCVQCSGSVELKRYPKSHPFAQLSGSDNIIAFTTQRYSQQPLIIRSLHFACSKTTLIFSTLLHCFTPRHPLLLTHFPAWYWPREAARKLARLSSKLFNRGISLRWVLICVLVGPHTVCMLGLYLHQTFSQATQLGCFEPAESAGSHARPAVFSLFSLRLIQSCVGVVYTILDITSYRLSQYLLSGTPSFR